MGPGDLTENRLLGSFGVAKACGGAAGQKKGGRLFGVDLHGATAGVCPEGRTFALLVWECGFAQMDRGRVG